MRLLVRDGLEKEEEKLIKGIGLKVPPDVIEIKIIGE